MSLERKLLIVFGSLVLAFIIAGGAFSIGLYMGQHGIFPESPSITGPVKRPAADQPQPNAGPGVADQALQPRAGDAGDPLQSLLPRPMDLVGPVLARDEQGITIGSPRGSRLVRVDSETQIMDVQGQQLKLEELSVGSRVGIVGQLTDDGKTMAAEIVVLLPGQAPATR